MNQVSLPPQRLMSRPCRNGFKISADAGVLRNELISRRTIYDKGSASACLDSESRARLNVL